MPRNNLHTPAEVSPAMRRQPTARLVSFGLLLVLALAAVLLGSGQAAAQSTAETAKPLSPLHPVFAMLDADGQNVLESGAPVSTMQTCGACHNLSLIHI